MNLQKKPYRPPAIVEFNSETATARLRAAADQGNTGARHMLREAEKHGLVTVERPMLQMEVKFPAAPGAEPEISLAADHLALEHLKLVRGWLNAAEEALAGKVRNESRAS